MERVRSVFAIALFLTLSGLAVAESVRVQEIKRLESSRHVRIAVSLNARPARGATVSFCLTGNDSCLSAVADENGIADCSRLSDGDYIVTASLEDISGENLYLHVSRKRKASAFSIDLTESFRAQQSYMAAADELPISDTLQFFQGVIRDQTGANIVGANVKIVRRGSGTHVVIQRLQSDQLGHFSASLDPGAYVAYFSSSGFRTEIVPFQVAPQGRKELLVNLHVGQSSEAVSIEAKD